MIESGKKDGELRSRVAPTSRGAGWVFDGIREFREAPGPWIVISLLLMLGSVAAILLPVIGILAVFVLSPVIIGGLMFALEHRSDHQGLRVADMFAAFDSKHMGALLGVGVSSFVLNFLAFLLTLRFIDFVAVSTVLTKLAQTESMMASAADLTYALGLLTGALIYVALLIPITMMVWFAPALIVLEDEGVFSAMRHSFVGCARNFMPYLVYGLVGLLLFPLLVIFTLGLGLIVLLPVGLASIHVAYRDIFHRV